MSFRLFTYKAVGSALGPAYSPDGSPAAVLPNAQGVPPGILVSLSNGAVLTYNIEVSGDDPFAQNYVPNNGIWLPFPGYSGLSASQAGSLGALVRVIRLNVTAYTSGTVTLQFVQLVP